MRRTSADACGPTYTEWWSKHSAAIRVEGDTGPDAPDDPLTLADDRLHRLVGLQIPYLVGGRTSADGSGHAYTKL
jgi:hypothetical protein